MFLYFCPKRASNVSNLLRLVGEGSRGSGGCVLSERWGPRSVWEICKSSLAGESLASCQSEIEQTLCWASQAIG